MSQIRTAEAVVKDFGQEAAARNGVLLWAKADKSHSERTAHKVIKKQKTSLGIPMGTAKCNGVDG